MAKHYIGKMADEFINRKENEQKGKKPRLQDFKKQQTIYLQPSTIKLLWMNRALTGESISDYIDRIVRENLEGKHTGPQEKSSERGPQRR